MVQSSLRKVKRANHYLEARYHYLEAWYYYFLRGKILLLGGTIVLGSTTLPLGGKSLSKWKIWRCDRRLITSSSVITTLYCYLWSSSLSSLRLIIILGMFFYTHCYHHFKNKRKILSNEQTYILCSMLFAHPVISYHHIVLLSLIIIIIDVIYHHCQNRKSSSSLWPALSYMWEEKGVALNNSFPRFLFGFILSSAWNQPFCIIICEKSSSSVSSCRVWGRQFQILLDKYSPLMRRKHQKTK